MIGGISRVQYVSIGMDVLCIDVLDAALPPGLERWLTLTES